MQPVPMVSLRVLTLFLKSRKKFSEENNYSKRSYGLFRCKSSLIMTSDQDFFQILFLDSFSEGGNFCPPPTKIGGTKGPTKIGLKKGAGANGGNFGYLRLFSFEG